MGGSYCTPLSGSLKLEGREAYSCPFSKMPPPVSLAPPLWGSLYNTHPKIPQYLEARADNHPSRGGS